MRFTNICRWIFSISILKIPNGSQINTAYLKYVEELQPKRGKRISELEQNSDRYKCDFVSVSEYNCSMMPSHCLVS